jgi:glutathione S-transferase
LAAPIESRPLLGERMEVIVPPQHYDKVDF